MDIECDNDIIQLIIQIDGKLFLSLFSEIENKSIYVFIFPFFMGFGGFLSFFSRVFFWGIAIAKIRIFITKVIRA